MKKSAFTLLEMVVTLSLFALFLLLIFSLNNLLIQKWFLLQEQQRSSSAISLLLHKITRELRSSVFFPNSFFVDFPTIDSSCKKNLFFLTTTASLKTSGKISAVGYFFVRNKKESLHYDCYRYHLTPEETKEALHTNTLKAIFAKASPSDTKRCESVATSISDWKIQPAWIVHGNISSTPHPVASRQCTPDLLEITLRASTLASSQFGKTPAYTTAVSTVVALVPSP
jgi:prepilin-type N-terminal cleavage/methylation domain-containing protein